MMLPTVNYKTINSVVCFDDSFVFASDLLWSLGRSVGVWISDSYNADYKSGSICNLFKVVKITYWRQQSLDDRLIFANYSKL